MARPGDDLNPRFSLRVDSGSGTETDLGRELSSRVTEIEVEQAFEYVSKLSVTFANKDLGLLNERALQAGNEMSVYMGYGPKLNHVGRAVLLRHLPKFPADGGPTLTIEGFDLGYRMQETSPTQKLTKEERRTRRVRAKLFGRRVQDEPASIWRNITYSEIVVEKATKYGMLADVDGTLDLQRQVIQPREMTDYALVRGLANIVGRDFWIDWDIAQRRWVLHWRDYAAKRQQKAYRFRYDADRASTLLSFEPEFALDRMKTAVQIISIERVHGTLVDEDQSETEPADQDPRLTDPGELEIPIQDGSRIRLAIGEHAIEVIADRVFDKPDDAKKYVQRWARERADDFVTGQGVTVGTEDVFAGDIHLCEGIGPRLSGHYFMPIVRHKYADGGYTTEFVGRRVLERSPRAALLKAFPQVSP